MKAILWHDETMGAEYDVEDIPADLVDEANEWREKMVENAANFDDDLMEKYLEGAEISEEQLIAAIRKGTIAMEITPMLLGSSYKNKGVQPLLDYRKRSTASLLRTSPHRLWHSRLPLTHSWAVWYSSVSTLVRLLPVLTCTTPAQARRSASAVCSR